MNGMKLGASSGNTVVINPHFSDCTTKIELLGTNLYRQIHGVAAADVTNTGGDTTTLLTKGNEVYSDQRWIGAAPTITYESTNGTSGIRFNLQGTASSNHYRWQVAGTTQLELTSGTLLAGDDNAQSIGATTKRWLNGNFSGYVSLGDGITAPATVAGSAFIYVDAADGDLKIKFGDGTVKTIAVDT